MIKVLIGILIGIIVLVIGYGVYRSYIFVPAKRHVHAGFRVYVDGKLQDFSNIRYMSLKPCDTSGKRPTRAQIQDEMAHLHDNVGYVAHSHREGATWGDLFQNMKFEVDRSKGITAFINGKEVEDVFSYPLNKYDSAVIFVGSVDKSLLDEAVTKEQIVNVEQTSADCGVDH